MRRSILLVALILFSISVFGQTYLIDFAGTGESNTISTVIVKNLTTGISLTLNGNDILRLSVTTGVNPIENAQSSELKIYPNPMTYYSTIEIWSPVAGDAVITVNELTGKPIARLKSYLEIARQDFKLSGLKRGIYLVNVKGRDYQFSGKLLSNGKSGETINIEKVNSIKQAFDQKSEKEDSKGMMSTVDMQYTTGDKLKLTGISGDYTIIKTDIPTASKTITFNFISCKDGDNNNYPVSEIGTQKWMAENLKTTKYSNGDLIGTTSPATLDMLGISNPVFQWAYGGNESNVATYGRLYTWFITDAYCTTNRNVCPAGWHVPTDDEWTILTDFLTNNGYGYQGSGSDIAKSMAASSGWTINLITGTAGNDQTANNSSGLSAVPGGYRQPEGPFETIGSLCRFWTSTSFGGTPSYSRSMSYDGSNVVRGGILRSVGCSIRCLKD